jgi:hypothetical protein
LTAPHSGAVTTCPVLVTCKVEAPDRPLHGSGEHSDSLPKTIRTGTAVLPTNVKAPDLRRHAPSKLLKIPA